MVRHTDAGQRIWEPQEGPQTILCSSPADIVFYGGEAGGGKSMGLLMDPLRGINTPGFGAVIFRRTYKMITKEGGLWDKSMEFYSTLGGVPRETKLDWTFGPHGCKVTFAHMVHESSKLDWMGAELSYIGFDEITHFTESQFWYMISRMRSTCGFRPCLRATCNPEPYSWVHRLLEWWIDPISGVPIPERSGVIRWFMRRPDGSLDWRDNRTDFEPHERPKSFTFIRARLSDNPALTEKDPDYESNLDALPAYERSILKDGNWLVRKNTGSRFKRHWFKIYDQAPKIIRAVRFYDLASTEPHQGNIDPDATAGVLLGEDESRELWVLDVRREQLGPSGVLKLIDNTATSDRVLVPGYELFLELEGGSSGKTAADSMTKDLRTYAPRWIASKDSKWSRSAGASASAERGHIRLVKGPWNEKFLTELEAFIDDSVEKTPAGYHDDQVDALSGAFNQLATKLTPSIRRL